MLKIIDCPLSRFQNEVHYKFLSDFKGLITYYTPATLLIGAEYLFFLNLFADEGEALNFVRKSIYSDQLNEVDLKSNETLDGLEAAIMSGVKHYTPAVKEAAKSLKVLWDITGDIKTKAQKNKAGALLKLVADLKGLYSAEVAIVGLGGWVAELEADILAYNTVETNRYNEKENRTDLRMKEVRVDIDDSYRTITTKVNALIVVNGEAPYLEFVRKLNLHIDEYNNGLAMRKGRGNRPTNKTTPEA